MYQQIVNHFTRYFRCIQQCIAYVVRICIILLCDVDNIIRRRTTVFRAPNTYLEIYLYCNTFKYVSYHKQSTLNYENEMTGLDRID